MVAKGLDYPEVELVGVINADTTLHMPDFRAGERTYQLLEQVAGRAGRGEAGGRVIVQTYWPDHPAVVAVARHGADGFYEAELRERDALGYPPAGRLARVVVTGASHEDVAAAATSLAEELRARAQGAQVLGPSPAPLAKLKGACRWHVLVKAPPGADMAPLVRDALGAVGTRAGIAFAPDIDPLDMM